MAQVLLVEDEPEIRMALVRALGQRGHGVRAFGEAMAGILDVTANPPDVVVLDLGLPDLDGALTLSMIRAVSEVPVIIATARDGEREIIRLLNAGADDYLVKPFSADHLAARITTILRRSGVGTCTEVIEIGALRIDVAAREAHFEGAPLRLSRREFNLLAYLAARAGRVVSRRELLTEVWQAPYGGDDQTIDVHISWLRRKLGETAAAPCYLHTVRGVGVKLAAPG
jgi:DNA-binding response OmpR family regulator